MSDNLFLHVAVISSEFYKTDFKLTGEYCEETFLLYMFMKIIIFVF